MNINSLLKRIDSHLEHLHAEGLISEPTRGKFFKEYLDCHELSWKNWYSRGVRVVYIRIIDLLDKLEEVKK